MQYQSAQKNIVEEYSSGLDSWLEARKNWDSYRKTVNSSDPRLKRMDQFIIQLLDLLPHNAIVVDLGSGPEGRDVAEINGILGKEKNIEAIGIELVSENIESAIKLHPSEVQGKLKQGNIIEGIPLPDTSVDGIVLSSVIQHIQPKNFYERVVPNIFRILKEGGILYISFKRTDNKTHLMKFEDKMMGNRTRELYVYNQDELMGQLEKVGLKLYEGDETHFGGKLNWEDQVRGLPMAGMYFIKELRP